EVKYLDGHRHPLITDVTGFAADGGRIFPVDTVIPGKTFVKNTDVAPRIGIAYNVTGKGDTVLKAFYGRYYNNLADGFSAVNPGDISIAEYNFRDVQGDHRFHGPENLGTLRLRAGADSTPVDPNFKTPYTEEVSGSFE